METNRYAPPKVPVRDFPHATDAPALWNPKAAANWCLLLSPMFGAWLHMKNWQALGEPKKAATARVWVVVSGIVLAMLMFAPAVLERPGVTRLAQLLSFVVLIAWYFGSARGQALWIEARYRKDYPRRGWAIPILIALGLLIGASLLASVLETLLRLGAR